MFRVKTSSKVIALRLLKGGVSIGLLIFLAKTVDWHRITTLNSTSFIVIGMGVLVTMFLILFMALRWSLLVRRQTIQPFSIFTAYRGYLIGLFFNIFMPGAIGGDFVRMKYCKDRCDLTLKTSGLVIVTERLFGLTALSLFFTIGLLNNYQILPGLSLDLTMVVLMLSISFCIVSGAKYWISRRINIDKRIFLVLVFLSLMGQSADIVSVGLLIWTFGYTVVVSQLLFIMPLVYVATVLPISLGGLGMREGVLAGMLSIYGVNVSDAIIIAFMLYLIKACIGITMGLPMFMQERIVLTGSSKKSP